ncbi:MAG: DinB family protein [Mycobacteriales bacterium]
MTETRLLPDTKDWTWVLERPCAECGFDATSLSRADVGDRLLQAARDLVRALAGADVRRRPAPQVWSPLEYGCHVRDVCRVFAERLQLMLRTEEPRFANWDQDATALADDYAAQDPRAVADALWDDAQVLAAQFAAVTGADWERTGTRSDGARFTVASLGRYLVHDPVHHVFDVTGARQS